MEKDIKTNGSPEVAPAATGSAFRADLEMWLDGRALTLDLVEQYVAVLADERNRTVGIRDPRRILRDWCPHTYEYCLRHCKPN